MDITGLKGVGPATEKKLRAMGIHTLRDLLYYFPFRYEDQSKTTAISELQEGNRFLIRGVVSEKPKMSYFHGLSRATAQIEDETGRIRICWFNTPWIIAQLPLNTSVLLYGQVKQSNGKKILYNPQIVKQPGIVPIYHSTRGIPLRTYRRLIAEALEFLDSECPESLPATFLSRYQLCSLSFALRQIHFPEAFSDLIVANRRLSFEHMLMYLFSVASLRESRQTGYSMTVRSEATAGFWKKTGFQPTNAQRRVLNEIASDISRDTAMSRLVQGDVGCGKTAIAFGAITLCVESGFQAAMMAPTEILARQHYENALQLLQTQGIPCRLLTGSTRAAERKRILAELAAGECKALFGTHALISENVSYCNLGLVITDEQHRFGVHQRSQLQEKGMGKGGRAPHVLVMSATPIPRTLALILYGDLDLSVIDELPPGRKPVQTRLVPENRRDDMYHFLRMEIKKGRQAYIVCPLVEDSEENEQLRSARSVFEELSANQLKGLRIGLTWGKQKADEKAKILKDFTEGNCDVLVSTTVIEVGVNVPNATVMIIENAERFGLSQLHQLRGRVGRGKEESWCFLLAGKNDKLNILCQTNDGFLIAQRDLELRGPGDLMGTRQSGEPLNGVIFSGDTRLLDEVNTAVKDLYENDSRKEEKKWIENNAGLYLSEMNMTFARN